MSDSVGQYRYGTAFDVEFPLLPSLTHRPRKAFLSQGQGEHDILTLEFTVPSATWLKIITTGAPVKFTWTVNKLSGFWVGYVYSVKQNWNKAKQNVMEITCLGSTFPLKDSGTEVFKNTTIPQAVGKIAKKFGFKYTTKPHPLVYSSLTMLGNISYWEWIQQLASTIGYGISVNNMELQFLPLDELINKGSYSAPVLSADSQLLPTNTGFIDKKLDSFQILSGDYLEGGIGLARTTKRTGGVDPVTNRAFTKAAAPDQVGKHVRSATTDVLFDEVATSLVTGSAKAATELAKGAAQAARLTTPAKIQCQGDPRIKPFSPVYLENAGTDVDGFWVVAKATHKFSTIGEYQMDIVALTDGKGPNKQSPFRKTTGSAVGLVDLESALKKQSAGGNLRQGSVPRLEVKTQVVKQTGQGFKKTFARWKAQ